jgi:amino acid transporter
MESGSVAAGVRAGGSGKESPNQGDRHEPSLRRTLTYSDLLIYGIAYVTPFGVLQSLGFVWQESNGLMVLAYVLGSVCMYFTAKSYAMMTETVPSAGSVYGFARHSLGPFAGFIAGWMILLDYLLIPAYVYVIMAVALGSLMPQVDRATWIMVVTGTTLAVNWFGVRVSQRFNLVCVAIQLAILALLVLLSIVALYHGKGNGGLTLRPLYAPELFHIKNIFAATSICVISFLGFDAISTLSEEVKGDDKRTVGRAIIGVLFLSAGLFAVLSWVFGDLMSGLKLKDPAAAIYELSDWAIGPWMTLLVAWAMATAAGIASALPMQVGVARVLFAMGRDRQLPAAFAKVHPTYGTPYVGMIVTAAISITVGLGMRFHPDELASIVNFGALTGFLLLHVSVIALFWIKNRSGRWIAHLLVPVLGIIVVLAVLSGMSSIAMTLGVSWLGIGLAYGAFLRKRRRTELAIDLR